MKKIEFPIGKGKYWLILAGAVLLCVLGIGVWLAMDTGSKTVSVYPFSYLGMTEYWGDNQESYGPVITDKIQTVFLSDTQTVTEVLVREGDSVSQGDLLMTFDTTLSELQLERKRLEVEQERLRLQREKDRLNELLNTSPWEPTEPPAETEPDPGVALSGTWKLAPDPERDGTTQERAVICWLKTGVTLDAGLLAEIYEAVAALQTARPGSNPSRSPEIFPPNGGVILEGTVTTVRPRNESAPESSNASESSGESSAEPSSTAAASSESAAPESSSTETAPPSASQETTVPPSSSSETTVPPSSSSETTVPPSSSSETTVPPSSSSETTVPPSSSSETTVPPSSSSETTVPPSSSSETTLPPETTEPTVPEGPEGDFYIIFRTSQDDMSNKEVLTWEGLYVKVIKNGFSFQFFPAPYLQDLDPFYVASTLPEPDLDMGFGYTAAELQKMINEQRKAIRDQEFKLRVAENAYAMMEKELSDGNIYAQIDGIIVSIEDEEASRMNKQPFLKLSGGGGFLVRGSVSELAKEELTIGQEVTVNDWNTGSSYTGTIREIGDFPSQGSGWNGMGNPTATYYPFTVFVDETANLQAGAYASIQYSSGAGAHGIYLQNPFLRTENGQTYVLARGENGRLERRTVITGKNLWGSYTEVLSGVTEEDFLAFPYGREARPGAQTQEGDLDALYQY